MVEINPFSALGQVGQAAGDRKAITENFDTFLTLLTTQLKNQNPLDPLDTNQFTQQLVQFTQVEQALKANENLEALLQLSAASVITGAVGFVGKEVTAKGDTTQLSGGVARWHYDSPQDSAEAVFTIRNSRGEIVFSETRPLTAGQDVYEWDGYTNSGQLAPEGEYSLSIRPQTENGTSFPVSLSITGRVDGVDMSGQSPVLLVAGRQVRLEDVIAFRTPTTS